MLNPLNFHPSHHTERLREALRTIRKASYVKDFNYCGQDRHGIHRYQHRRTEYVLCLNDDGVCFRYELLDHEMLSPYRLVNLLEQFNRVTGNKT